MKTLVSLLTCLFLLGSCSPAYADFVPGGNPCLGVDGTIQSVTGATSGTSATQIIAAITGKQIFVCSLNVQGVSGTTPTFSLVYGTGSNCAGTPTTFVTPIATAAGTLFNFSGPIGRVPVSQELCYQGGGTTPIQNYLITYIQK